MNDRRTIPLRRTGASTRIIDRCIQELFTKGTTFVRDHHPTREATQFLFRSVLKRLHSEHEHVMQDLKINNEEFSISLRNGRKK